MPTIDLNNEATISSSHGGRTLADYLRVLLRRRWTFLGVFVAIFGFTALKAFTTVPIYSASAQLLIERTLPRMLPGGQFQYDYSGEDFYQTRYKLLESPALAKRVAEKLRQQKHPLVEGYYRNLLHDADEVARQKAEQGAAAAVRGGLV